MQLLIFIFFNEDVLDMLMSSFKHSYNHILLFGGEILILCKTIGLKLKF